MAHAILTFNRNDKKFQNGVPEVKFELNGIPLYDVRADSSVGGTGTQRWDDPATWQPTRNALVIAYNIFRGITLPTGELWGCGATAEDVPVTSWVPAINTCDLGIGDDLRPQFEAGFEIRFQDEPADILEELLASSNAQVSELGGVWTVQAGAPAPAIAHITDGDVLVSEPQDFDPFPGIAQTFNAITVAHPSPEALWNPNSKAAVTNSVWEAEDGGQRLLDLVLPAVSSSEQARQLANNVIRDSRRMRTHKLELPPDYFYLETLQGLT